MLEDSVVCPRRRANAHQGLKPCSFSLRAEARTWPDGRCAHIAYAAAAPRFTSLPHHDLRRACTSVLNVPRPHGEIHGERPPIPGGCRGQCGTPVPRRARGAEREGPVGLPEAAGRSGGGSAARAPPTGRMGHALLRGVPPAPWAAPSPRSPPWLWRLLHNDGRQGSVGNDCATWGNVDDYAESARAPE